ncbi:MAG: hypothetical protein KDG50_12170 [Chromatiales bacterium]|nr:hypothetical protein [Chromatiales bacterium]
MSQLTSRRHTLLLVAGFSAPASALVAAPGPAQVPMLDSWGLVGLGVSLALAGFIAAKRLRR